jgi:uncharacterized membrane protein YukC
METITKTEFQEHCKQNEEAFQEVIPVIKKLEPLADLVPVLKESAELKKSTDKVVNTLTRRAKIVAIFLGIIAVLLTIYLNIRHIFIDVVIKK